MLSRLLLQGASLCDRPAAAGGAAAAVSRRLQQYWSSFSSSAAASSSSSAPTQPQGSPELTPEQQQHLDTLRYLIARPLEAAQNAALLTALTASYRDLFVVMDQFHKKDILGVPRPLLDEPPQTSSSSSQANAQQQQQQQQQQLNHSQMLYPLRDFTKLPDQPPPPGGFWAHHLKEEHMASPRAHMQTLPNHLEVSYHNDAFIYLWPPMEMFYPRLFDIGNVLRHLRPHLKRTRVSKSKKRARVRCSLGYRRNKPYHKQRVFGTPSVPAVLRVAAATTPQL